jgi:predicted permease
MHALIADTRYALRALARAPGFTAAAVGTLALGIGATSAVFTLTHEALFTPPAVAVPQRLAMVYTTSSRGAPRSASSYPDFVDARDWSRSFDDMAAYSWVPVSVGGDSEAGFATGQLVTGNYFTVLGVAAAHGRTLLPTDDARGAPQSVVVLSDAYWRRRFGAAPSALGSTLRLNGVAFTVVGVLPSSFRGLEAGRGADVWLPLQAGPRLGDGAGAVSMPGVFDTRSTRWLAGTVGRLAAGASVAQARAEMAGISRRLGALDQAARGDRSITVDPLPHRILPTGAETDIARFLILLLGVVGSTLLLASSNLANLLLARASARQRELGIRVALGAGRGRLVRQLLTESVALAGLGAVAGIVVAVFALDLLAAFALPGGLAVGDLAVGLDARLLLTAGACAGGSAVLFGLVPALQATRAPAMIALRGDSTQAAGGAIRRWLVAAQVALSLVLLVGAALFLRTLQRALVFDPGFRAEGVTVARFSLALLGYDSTTRSAFADRVREATTRLPGVAHAAVGTLVPFQAGGHRGVGLIPTGYEPAPDESMRADLVHVSPHYFAALGIPVTRGRAIDATDRAGGRLVAVISATAARRWWGDREPVGSTLRLRGPAGPGPEYEVVGVAGDVVWESLGDTPTPYVFFALAQASPAGSLTLAVRSTAAPAAVLQALRADIRALDPDLAIMAQAPLADWVDDTIAPQRVAALLLTAFGILALVIAALGTYGVVSFAVARQTRAIGVRLALGAPRGHVAALVARGIAGPVAAGVIAGLVGSWALARTVRAFLFQVDPRDPLTFLVVALLLAVIAAAATLGPTLRATRIAPMEALRHE